MYGHIMALRRIFTPHDLGVAVREARTAAGLTQAELAERADVSREWLIGLERGTRPRAELTKILGVLAALDQPLALGREEQATPAAEAPRASRGGAAMSTSEITQRAVERTRQRGAVAGSALSDMMANTPVSTIGLSHLAGTLPKTEMPQLIPPTTLASLMPKVDLATLMGTQMADVISRADYTAVMPKPSLAMQKLLLEANEASTRSAGDGEGQEEKDEQEHQDDAEGTRW